MKERKFRSTDLERTLNFFSDCLTDYKYNYDKVNEQEKLTQDYLHDIELGGLHCKERSKVATKLQENRKNRRYYKDVVEELQPIYDFLNDGANKALINKLREVLGKVRKAESYHSNRTYFPRVERK